MKKRIFLLFVTFLVSCSPFELINVNDLYSAASQQVIVEKWFCPNCGTECHGNFCTNCGTGKPE